MSSLLNIFGTAFDLALVVIGFGFIVFLHELGHFMAARWAGIRVLAFAIGFGPAALSFRKGLGWRRGSSEEEYRQRIAVRTGAGPDSLSAVSGPISPTEYRFNVLPFGGYVKMLGQEDANPLAISDAPDSYQSCKPWKRMVVISAGVIMNVILAAVLFVVVYMIGLQVEPAKVGGVAPGSPASKAVALNADQLGVQENGLQGGDVLTSINEKPARSFNDLVLATAMSGREDTVRLVVQRDGVAEPLRFEIKPEAGRLSGLLELGVEPGRSARVLPTRNEADLKEFEKFRERLGLGDLKPGMTLVQVGENTNVKGGNDLIVAMRRSGGKPVALKFADDTAGTAAEITLKPVPALQVGLVTLPGGAVTPIEHLAGLTPVMTVMDTGTSDEVAGLRAGDIFARIGSIEYPSLAQGIAEIRGHKGRKVKITVLRAGDDGTQRSIQLECPVNGKGVIGFMPGDTSAKDTLLSLPLPRVTKLREKSEAVPTPAASLALAPGSRVVSVAGMPVSTLGQIRVAMQAAIASATPAADGSVVIPLVVRPSLPVEAGGTGLGASESSIEETLALKLPKADAADILALGWESPVSVGLFEPEQTLLKADGPIEALRTGLAETQRVMMTTYITFARLFEGTVKVEHLKGPVGIAHLGTIIADRGFIWLLFFLALISVNLAVVNFLPLPIVDGGQFLFILYEQITGKPVPLGVQNATTIAGLLFIGTMFLIVTFNDVANLIGL